MAENNEGTITIKKDAIWKYSTFVLLAVIVLAGIIWVLPNNPSPTGNAVNNGNLPAPTSYNIEVTEDDHFLQGSMNSQVFVVEYSDFECPFCQRAYLDAVTQMKAKYGDELGIVYKQFPLTSIHPNAQKAAEASECAADQGKFTEMHDIMFEQGVVGGVATFKAYAAQLGLDTAKFDACLDSGEKADEVRADTAEAQEKGRRGTPYFLIASESDGKGTVVSGAQPFPVFQQIIDSKL